MHSDVEVEPLGIRPGEFGDVRGPHLVRCRGERAPKTVPDRMSAVTDFLQPGADRFSGFAGLYDDAKADAQRLARSARRAWIEAVGPKASTPASRRTRFRTVTPDDSPRIAAYVMGGGPPLSLIASATVSRRPCWVRAPPLPRGK